MTATPNTDALNALLERVEAGTIDGMTPHCDLPAMHVLGAYVGSLDAAKALHEAVLPVYRFRIEDFRAEIWWGPSGPFIGASEIPSRAWLIAIIRALSATNTY